MNLKNKLIIGCAQTDENYGLSKHKKFEEVLNNAIKSGINFLDTSPHYKNNNSIIKKFTNKKNSQIISKLKFDYNLDRNFETKIKKAIEEELSSYNVDNLYAILIHDPLLPLNSDKWKIVSKVLNKYKKKNLIKKIGISIYNTFELDNILPIRVFSLQICILEVLSL